MAGTIDQVQGRVKEAAGALGDDDRLRSEGKADQLAGKAKDAFERTADKAKDAFDRAADKAKEVAHKVVGTDEPKR